MPGSLTLEELFIKICIIFFDNHKKMIKRNFTINCGNLQNGSSLRIC